MREPGKKVIGYGSCGAFTKLAARVPVHVLPASAASDVVDGVVRGTKRIADLSGFPCVSDQLDSDGGCCFCDLHVVVLFSPCVGAVHDSVTCVGLGRIPAKVVRRVVCVHAVVMTTLHAFRAWSDECEKHGSVHCHSAAVGVFVKQCDVVIALGVNGLPEDEWALSPAFYVAPAADAAFVAGLVAVEPMNWPPLFFIDSAGRISLAESLFYKAFDFDKVGFPVDAQRHPSAMRSWDRAKNPWVIRPRLPPRARDQPTSHAPVIADLVTVVPNALTPLFNFYIHAHHSTLTLTPERVARLTTQSGCA